MRISPTESFTKGLELIEVEKNRWNKFQASFCLGVLTVYLGEW